MTSMLWNLAAFLLALGILVTIHEFGHFWVARCCGVKVERFSIGFGKALWRRYDAKGTEFVLAAIPLGGYVKMLDGRVDEIAPELQCQAFNNKTVGQRVAIVSAGPVANFIFAVLAYWLVFMIGVPSFLPVIEEVRPNSIAAQANISPNMELKSVAGIETPDWESVRLALASQIGEKETMLGVSPWGSGGPVVEKLVDLTHWQFEPDKDDPVTSLGIVPHLPEVEPVLTEVQRSSAAEKAGLQVGDRIVKVNGQPLNAWRDLVQAIKDNPNNALPLDVLRHGQMMTMTLTPDSRRIDRNHQEGFAGLAPKLIPVSDEYKTIRQYGPFAAFYQAGEKTWQLIKLTVSMLVKLITGDVKLNNLGGPVSIAQGAGISAEYGLIYYLMFLALISVNLGIINLFPLPVLDGGHLLFLVVEKLKGRPVSERVQAIGYRIGAVCMMLFMGLALFNDFSRL